VSARHCLLAIVLTCVAAALAGCGGGASSTAASTAEAHLAALANAICRESHTNRATGPPFEAHLKTEFAKLRALIRSDRKLPRVATYISDIQARDRLRTAMSKLSKKEVPYAFSLMEDNYRLGVKIQADLKALGMTSCIGPRPRKPIEG
jgi:hypothetical protein